MQNSADLFLSFWLDLDDSSVPISPTGSHTNESLGSGASRSETPLLSRRLYRERGPIRFLWREVGARELCILPDKAQIRCCFCYYCYRTNAYTGCSTNGGSADKNDTKITLVKYIPPKKIFTTKVFFWFLIFLLTCELFNRTKYFSQPA